MTMNCTHAMCLRRGQVAQDTSGKQIRVTSLDILLGSEPPTLRLPVFPGRDGVNALGHRTANGFGVGLHLVQLRCAVSQHLRGLSSNVDTPGLF